jgi:HEAT repeats
MRASPVADAKPRPRLLARPRARSLAVAIPLLLLLSRSALFSQAGVTALDPAFRLPAGGRALAGPVLDRAVAPPAAWLLSEDLSLYALTDTGVLAAHVDLASSRPGSLLAVDPFGRVLVALDGESSKAEIVAYTRMGRVSWRAPIETPGGAAASFSPAFGSDGRAFVLSGASLLCFSPSGLRLWSLALPAAASCPPGVDGRGYPCVGLADGNLLTATPYGEEESRTNLGSPALALCALPAPTTASAGTDPGAVAAIAAPTAVPGRPLLAASLADGRLLFLGRGGVVLGSHRAGAPIAALAWDGAILYCLDAAGAAFALAIAAAGPEPEPSTLWSCPTGCAKGALYLYPERLVAVAKGRAVSLSLGGEVFRELSVPGAAGMPAISPAGLAYSSGTDWVLAAYRFEKKLGAPVSPALTAYPPLPDIVSKELLFDPLAADPDRQLARLTDIHNSLRSGTIGAREPELAAYCGAVAARSLDRDLPEEERRRGSNPLVRSLACDLLGELGSVAYREPLFRAIEEDPDPAVRAEACRALAALLVDPDGRSMSAFLAAAARPVDERTALVIVDAIEGMALRSGTAPGGDALRALVRLTIRPYGQAVRSRAMAALGRISGASQ